MTPIERVQRRELIRVVLAAFAIIFVVACGAGDGDRAEPDETSRPWKRPVASFPADEIYPYLTLADQRTFTDAFVTIDATSERLGEIEGYEDVEGYQPRWVEVRVVETHWKRDGIEVPSNFESEHGLIIGDGEATYLTYGAAPPLEVGRRYLAGLLRDPDTGEIDLASLRALHLIENGNVVPSGVELDPMGDPSVAVERPTPVETFVATIVETDPLVPDSIESGAERRRRWSELVTDGAFDTSTTTEPP